MKLIILDRDGVINHDSFDYIKTPDEWLPITGSLDAIARLTQCGYTIAVATNQSGISRGLYDEAMLNRIHDKMRHLVALEGGSIDSIWHCPHLPDFGCICRKPSPGMLHSIAEHYSVNDLCDVNYIGDRVTDIQAAKRARAKPILIQSPMTDSDGLAEHGEVPCYRRLSDAVSVILT
jgi:D-glycero-D-manno-heptose 1,7-bisphosphate phosphatase